MTSKRKVVIITGASRGIGAAPVKRFRELDYGVVAKQNARAQRIRNHARDLHNLDLRGDEHA